MTIHDVSRARSRLWYLAGATVACYYFSGNCLFTELNGRIFRPSVSNRKINLTKEHWRLDLKQHVHQASYSSKIGCSFHQRLSVRELGSYFLLMLTLLKYFLDQETGFCLMVAQRLLNWLKLSGVVGRKKANFLSALIILHGLGRDLVIPVHQFYFK
jgi:hypothetical protein